MRSSPAIESTGDGVRLLLHVQPRAARSELAGRHGEALKIRLAAPPVDGAANRALLRFLADILELPLAALSLDAGAASRRKVVRVRGMSAQAAAEKLGVELPRGAP